MTLASNQVGLKDSAFVMHKHPVSGVYFHLPEDMKQHILEKDNLDDFDTEYFDVSEPLLEEDYQIVVNPKVVS